MSEHIQNVKDGGAILLHLTNGGRGGRPQSRGRRGCQFRPLGQWSGRGGQRHHSGWSLERIRPVIMLGTKLSFGRSHRGHSGKRSRRDV